MHTPRFWYLLCSPIANNNSYISWWQNYSGNIWWLNGCWSTPGVNECCGAFDPSSCSKTMQVVIDSNNNEGTVDHITYSNIELAEKTRGNSFNFCRNYNIEADKIPRFNINNFQSTGAGGTSIFDVVGFYENDESLDYWIVLMDGT